MTDNVTAFTSRKAHSTQHVNLGHHKYRHFQPIELNENNRC